MATWAEANGQAVNLDAIEWVYKHDDKIDVYFSGEKKPRVLDLELKTAIWATIQRRKDHQKEQPDRSRLEPDG